ncbi:hypothetical protein BGX28_007225, partial [Mortierella sp. GBA30]
MDIPNARITIKSLLMGAISLQCLASSIAVPSNSYSTNRIHNTGLSKRWHSEPPPVLQRPCLVVDRANDRTYMMGYDSQNTLTFNFLDSTKACNLHTQHEKHKDDIWLEGDDKNDNGFDWKYAQWTSLPYPGGVHRGRRFATEHCFLSSDHKFTVPSFEQDGEGGFSVWDHEKRTWTHSRIDRPCSCHGDDAEKEDNDGGKVKKDAKRIKFEYPNLSTVVYQSYRAHGRPGHDDNREEAIDTVVIQWKDRHERDHLTGIQLVNHQVYSCHDIKIGRNVLPEGLTLATSPNNPYHYTYYNTPKKYKTKGDHGSRCEKTTLFLLGKQGSGWFDISISDRPSKRPVDIIATRNYKEHHGFRTLPGLKADHTSAVYYGKEIYIFGKNQKDVAVWTIDTSDRKVAKDCYEIKPKSQGSSHPAGDLTCARCGHGILVYGSCDRAEDCSTNLRPGEKGERGGDAPIVIYRPCDGNKDNDDDDDDEDDENSEGEGETGGTKGVGEGGSGSGAGSGSGSGGSGSGGSGSGGSGSGGSGSGSGGSGSGGSGSGSGGSGSG